MPVYTLLQGLHHPGMSFVPDTARQIEPTLLTTYDTVQLCGFASFLVLA